MSLANKSRDEGRAWVRVALVKSAEESAALRRAEKHREIQRKRLANDLAWVRNRLNEIEKKMAGL